MTTCGEDILSIEDSGGRRLVQLNPAGTIIGRTNACDVVLDSQLVSRTHARLFRDPFERWIVEDLHSHNGVIVDGQRVDRVAIAPGRPFSVGPFRLKIVTAPEEPAEYDRTVADGTSSCLDARPVGDVVHVPDDAPQTLTGRWMKNLNRLGECLSGVMDPPQAYSEACRFLADELGMAAIVMRIPPGDSQMPPRILASQYPPGQSRQAGPEGQTVLSHRVVESVRTTDQAVLASDVPSGEAEMRLTVVDDAAPRSVACVPITAAQAGMEALYVEVSPNRARHGLLDFARAAARQIDFARRAAIGAGDQARRQLLEQELTMARRLQDGLIPKSLVELPGVDLALYYEPTLWVGGDYCDVWRLRDDQIAFAIGDVAGKGLSAALAMANLHAMLRASLAHCDNLLEVVSYANEHVLRHLPEDRFVTAIVGTFHAASGRLVFVNAGHPIPFTLRSGEVAEAGRPLNPPLGVTLDFSSMPVTVDLAKGEAMVLFTDGITEAASPAGDLLGADRLRQALMDRPFPRCADLVKAVVDTASGFREQAPQRDDVTVLALRRKA